MVNSLRRWRQILRGAREYYTRPELRCGFGGPFNNQKVRQQVFTDIIAVTKPVLILETGTFRGSTSEFMFRSSTLPVHTVESDPLCFGFAFARFLFVKQVKVHFGDSRNALDYVLRDGTCANVPVFAYLDAHWGEDLPLGEEVDIIFRYCSKAVIMIDDFKVPFDAEYAYDSYGGGGGCSIEYLRRQCGLPLAYYFPRSKAEQETGAKRGCVVVAKDTASVSALDNVSLLKRWN